MEILVGAGGSGGAASPQWILKLSAQLWSSQRSSGALRLSSAASRLSSGALSSALELSGSPLELSGSALELSGSALELSGSPLELSGSPLELSGSALEPSVELWSPVELSSPQLSSRALSSALELLAQL